METFPALRPPPGQVSNFINPQSLMRWSILCVVLCLFVATTLLALRTYVRLAIKRQWILEDYMCYISWVGLAFSAHGPTMIPLDVLTGSKAGLIAYCTTTSVAFARHGGVHEWDITKSQARELSYLFNVTSIEYSVAILATKLSVLLLYRRVFSPQRWSVFDIAIRILMVVLTLFYSITFFVKIFECAPRARIWDKSLTGSCLNIPKILNTSGSFNTVSDILILLIPVKAIWQLQMKKKKKAGIIAVFTVGLIAPIFSIIGFAVRLKDSANPDNSYYNAIILLWAAAEIASGICCVCLPTLAALTARRGSPLQRPSIQNPLSKSLNSRNASRKPMTLTMDEDMFRSRDYVELKEGGGVEVRPSVVITRIEGGVDAIEVMDGDAVGYPDTMSGRDAMGMFKQPMGIMKTVGIEQSYV